LFQWLVSLGSALPNGTNTSLDFSGAQKGASVAVSEPDSSGRVWIAGTVYGPIDVGRGPEGSTGSDNLFVAQFDGTGSIVTSGVLSAPMGSTMKLSASDVLVPAAGAVVVSGTLASGSLELTPGASIAATGTDGFVVRMTTVPSTDPTQPASLAVSAARHFRLGSNEAIGALARRAGKILVGGKFRTKVEVVNPLVAPPVTDGNGCKLIGTAENHYAGLWELDAATLACSRLTTLPGSSSTAQDTMTVTDVVVLDNPSDPQAAIFLTGGFRGSISTPTKSLSTASARDGFVAAYPADLAVGQPTWLVRARGRTGENDVVSAMIVDGSSVWIAGSYGGGSGAGAGSIGSDGPQAKCALPNPGAGRAAFVARLEATNGACSTNDLKVLNGDDNVEPFSLIRTSGGVLVAGVVSGWLPAYETVPSPTPPVKPRGFVLEFDPQGMPTPNGFFAIENELWSYVNGTVAKNGNLWIVGSYGASFDTLTTNDDIYVGSLAWPPP
jgi:hypothetical protein